MSNALHAFEPRDGMYNDDPEWARFTVVEGSVFKLFDGVVNLIPA